MVVLDVALELLDDLIRFHQLLRHRLDRRLQLAHVALSPLQVVLKLFLTKGCEQY